MAMEPSYVTEATLDSFAVNGTVLEDLMAGNIDENGDMVLGAGQVIAFDAY